MTMTAAQRWVLALTSLAALMIMLDALEVTTALHAIQLDLHASIGDLEWTIKRLHAVFCRAADGLPGLGDDVTSPVPGRPLPDPSLHRARDAAEPGAMIARGVGETEFGGVSYI